MGAEKSNTLTETAHRLTELESWIPHISDLNGSAIYIGPLFESSSHGYDTRDYKLVDRRLGTNEDFRHFTKLCHEAGSKVGVDGVFNHTGRDFFALKDIQEKRQNSPYVNWYCNVNFSGNTEYNDGFSYENWGGYNLLVKLNQQNTEVQNYIFDAIRFWVAEFDIDGIRLDAADVLDHGFMHAMRQMTDAMKPDFWLMGEVIHGDYSRWVNDGMLHSVTNYELHKGLYSGHNDHNYFEIAHSVKRLLGICGDYRLYTFMDNHDVERIYSKLNNKEHMGLVTLLVYTLYGIPSMYYGSEFGIEGKKEQGSDWNLRPHLELADYADAYTNNPITALCVKLGELKKQYPELSEGRYQELSLTNRQFAYARALSETAMITLLNCDDEPTTITVQAPVGASSATDMLGQAEHVQYENGQLQVTLPANCGTVIYLGEKVEPITTEKVSSDTEDPIAAEKVSTETEEPITAEKVSTETEEPIAAGKVSSEKNAEPSYVLLLNGSPHCNGSTATALEEVADALERNGVHTEIVQVGHLAVRSCMACGACAETGKCVIDDIVNEIAPKFEKADGLVVGSPVYYASANATLVACLTRLFYSTHFDKRMKVGASVVSARRGGCSASFDELNKFFTISGMPVASSQYWNSIHGNNADEAKQDGEGLQIMRTLGNNMAFLIKSIAMGKEMFGLPELEERIGTNFIR